MAEENGSETNGTILVAQCEPQDQHFATTLLSTVGKYSIVEANSSTGVIRGLVEGPDLILADPLIPGDFLRIVELMRRMPKLNHVAIVALSGGLSQVARCSGKGFNGFIEKPFKPDTFLSQIWRILDAQPPAPGDGSPAELNVEIDKIEGLPTLPTVYAQVEELCADPDVNAEKLAKVIESDPSITMTSQVVQLGVLRVLARNQVDRGCRFAARERDRKERRAEYLRVRGYDGYGDVGRSGYEVFLAAFDRGRLGRPVRGT